MRLGVWGVVGMLATGCAAGDDAHKDTDVVLDDTDSGSVVDTDKPGQDTDDTPFEDSDHWSDATDTDTVTEPRVLTFQCGGLTGGVCRSRPEGTARATEHTTGRVPSADRVGNLWYHTDAWEVRRHNGRDDVPVPGGGAFVRRAPNGQLVFQCRGLEGGICRMEWTGRGREQLVATGRVPDTDALGRILFHEGADAAAWHVKLRDVDGTVADLGVGANARWMPSGDVLFQCSGLEGGVCTMHDDGTARKTLSATGRSPDIDSLGRYVWHTDSYRLNVRTTDGVDHDIGDGAFGSWRRD